MAYTVHTDLEAIMLIQVIWVMETYAVHTDLKAMMLIQVIWVMEAYAVHTDLEAMMRMEAHMHGSYRSGNLYSSYGSGSYSAYTSYTGYGGIYSLPRLPYRLQLMSISTKIVKNYISTCNKIHCKQVYF
jgi:hypothetical protein